MIRGFAVMANGMHGALLLASGRAEGLRYLESDLAGAARSFWAAVLCLPGLLSLHAVDWAASGLPARPIESVVRDMLAYAVGWAGFAVISHAFAGSIGRGPRWPRFIAAWNWCNVIQYALLTLAAFPAVLGARPIISETADLVAVGWALWLEWFAARLTLEIAPLPAAAFVLMDVAIGLVLAAATG